MRQNREQREIDRRVLKFTVELFKILFKKGTPLNEKWHMALFHIVENKVWFCYFLGIVGILTFLLVSAF